MALNLVKTTTMANLLSMFILMEAVAGGFRFGVDGVRMDYYIMSCPFAESIVKNTVNRALQDDPTLAAALVRMHFHDCFVEVSLFFLAFQLFQLKWHGINVFNVW